MKYLTNLDLNKNQLLNAVLQKLATAPSAPVEGQIYYDTAQHRAFKWNGTAWVGMDCSDAVISDNGVTNAKLAQMPTMTIKGNNTAGTANADDLTAAEVKTVLGLSNVTDNAQIKKSASSTSGNIPTWDGTNGDALGAGYTVETTLSGAASAIPRADAVKTYVDALLSASDAMVFKGTLGTGGTITALPTTYSAGWAYKIITAGTYAGVVCEVGDLIIAIVDRAGSSNLDADWTVAQTNVDGAVIGPASATSGNIVLFDGVTGKIIKNSEYSPSSFAASDHNHDTVYTKKYAVAIGDNSATSFVVTHNLNTRDVIVNIREAATPYAMVIADIEFTSVNTITVSFAVKPTTEQYTVTVIG